MTSFRRVLGWTVGAATVVVLLALVVSGFAGIGQAGEHSASVVTPYTVTFNETGLPSGTSWSVHVAYVGCGCDGVTKTVTSTLPSIVVHVTNGTYHYRVLPVLGYYVNVSASGSFNVTGANVSAIPIVFHPVVPFLVQFSESGLPNGTLWTVSVTGNGQEQERALEDQTASSYGTELNFSELNGTYHYVVSPVPGSYFVGGSSHGRFVVAGASPPTIPVQFTTPPAYPVQFAETGLASGTNWSVRVWGISTDPVPAPVHETLSSDTADINFSLPNGTYHYEISEVLGFVINGSYLGTFSVTGGAGSFGVSYIALTPGQFYPVAFTEVGLPTGTHWAVKVIATHTIGHSRSEIQSGTSATLFFELQNGTYRFQVQGVRGYTATGTSGTFSIAGSSPATFVATFTVIPTYSVTFNETGLPNGTVWSILVRSESAHSTVFPVRVTEAANTTTIVFVVPNGTYCYSIHAVVGYKITTGTAAGSFTVAGASPPTISVGFTVRS